MATAERLWGLVEPLVAGRGLELVDVQVGGGVVRVFVDRPGGIDLDTVADLSEHVSSLLDRHDPARGRYILEVSSPGIERALRVPAHYVRAIGSEVSIRMQPEVEGDRRLTGRLTAADDEQITISLPDGSPRSLRYEAIERARTVFEWGPAATPERRTKKKRAS